LERGLKIAELRDALDPDEVRRHFFDHLNPNSQLLYREPSRRSDARRHF
jgi:hypothetical protein